MPPAITWDTVENAIQAWVADISGLPGNKCVWTYQGGAQPVLPYIALEIGSPRGVGQPWKNKTYDAVTDELVTKVRQHQVAILTLQFFSEDIGTPGTTGREPIELLSDVVAGVDLHEEDLDAGGVGIGEITPVQYVSPSKNGILRGRSIVTVTLHLASELERRGDYVDRFKMTATVQAENGDAVDATTFWDPPAGSTDPAPLRSFSSGFSSGFEVMRG